jgi:hypothetical protein
MMICFKDSAVFDTYQHACVSDMFPLIGTRIWMAGKSVSDTWDMVSIQKLYIP